MVNPMILAEDGKSIGNMLTQQFVGKKINDTKKRFEDNWDQLQDSAEIKLFPNSLRFCIYFYSLITNLSEYDPEHEIAWTLNW